MLILPVYLESILKFTTRFTEQLRFILFERAGLIKQYEAFGRETEGYTDVLGATLAEH